MTAVDHTGHGQGDAWSRVDVETVNVVGAAGVGQVVKSDDIVTVGRNPKVDQGVDAIVPPADLQQMPFGVEELEYRVQVRIDAFGPALDNDSLALAGCETMAVLVSGLENPSVDDHIQRNRLGDIGRVVRLGLGDFGAVADLEGSRGTDPGLSGQSDLVESRWCCFGDDDAKPLRLGVSDGFGPQSGSRGFQLGQLFDSGPGQCHFDRRPGARSGGPGRGDDRIGCCGGCR